MIDLLMIVIFLLSMMTSLFLSRRARIWTTVVIIIVTMAIGLRALFLFEFGSPVMAGVLGGLFILGLFAIRVGIQRAKEP